MPFQKRQEPPLEPRLLADFTGLDGRKIGLRGGEVGGGELGGLYMGSMLRFPVGGGYGEPG